MRFVVFGAGAIGGVVGGCLHQAGHEVALIARGDHYRAIRERGLTLEQPHTRVVLEIAVAAAPAEPMERRGDRDAGDQEPGHRRRGAGPQRRAPATTPLVCVQNGVENERVALRLMATCTAPW